MLFLRLRKTARVSTENSLRSQDPGSVQVAVSDPRFPVLPTQSDIDAAICKAQRVGKTNKTLTGQIGAMHIMTRFQGRGRSAWVSRFCNRIGGPLV